MQRKIWNKSKVICRISNREFNILTAAMMKQLSKLILTKTKTTKPSTRNKRKQKKPSPKRISSRAHITTTTCSSWVSKKLWSFWSWCCQVSPFRIQLKQSKFLNFCSNMVFKMRKMVYGKCLLWFFQKMIISGMLLLMCMSSCTLRGICRRYKRRRICLIWWRMQL